MKQGIKCPFCLEEIMGNRQTWRKHKLLCSENPIIQNGRFGGSGHLADGMPTEGGGPHASLGGAVLQRSCKGHGGGATYMPHAGAPMAPLGGQAPLAAAGPTTPAPPLGAQHPHTKRIEKITCVTLSSAISGSSGRSESHQHKIKEWPQSGPCGEAAKAVSYMQNMTAKICVPNMRQIFGHDGPFNVYSCEHENGEKYMLVLDMRTGKFTKIETDGSFVQTNHVIKPETWKKMRECVNMMGKAIGIRQDSLLPDIGQEAAM